eukprot:1711634-Prymnesium_polylepis.1
MSPSGEPLNPRGPKEHTPLVNEGKPSFELAMARARLRLLRDPDTNLPFSLWGLCASFKAFERLGQAAAAHTRIMSWSVLVCFATALLAVPLRAIANDPARVNEAGTVAAWTELTWGHVVLDVLMSLVFLAFIMREQLLLMEPSMFQGKLFQRTVVEGAGSGKSPFWGRGARQARNPTRVAPRVPCCARERPEARAPVRVWPGCV